MRHNKKRAFLRIFLKNAHWSWWRDSDPRPIDYESIALPLRHTSIAPAIAGTKGIITLFYKIVNIYLKKKGASHSD